ncbi:hypothetical protein [Bacillus badius]|uniref:hypothetical protein n=1 Tax=Bacillus badius TaxID=1455 RepID=UPI000597C18B|nr:hypothetical protein [Bacillus badius]KIL74735.1 hypothetical protein SD78_1804 [Bacillus badius]
MNLSMRDQLQQWKWKNKVIEERKIKWSKKKLSKRKEQPARKPESFSDSDLRYLMGVNMQTLKRGRGGAFKR